MKNLVLLRGPSGTGKSTISAALTIRAAQEDDSISKLCPITSAFHETDQFFTDKDGNYYFDVDKLKRAHAWNQLQTERSMLHNTNLIIVANTFIAHWEMEAYLELAEAYDYKVEIIRTPGPWDVDTLFQRNKHGVPREVIQRHIDGYQMHPNEQTWDDLSIFKK